MFRCQKVAAQNYLCLHCHGGGSKQKQLLKKEKVDVMKPNVKYCGHLSIYACNLSVNELFNESKSFISQTETLPCSCKVSISTWMHLQFLCTSHQSHIQLAHLSRNCTFLSFNSMVSGMEKGYCIVTPVWPFWTSSVPSTHSYPS